MLRCISLAVSDVLLSCLAAAATTSTTGVIAVTCSGVPAGSSQVAITARLAASAPGCGAGTSSSTQAGVSVNSCGAGSSYAKAPSGQCFKHVRPSTPINQCKSTPSNFGFANRGPGTAELRMAGSYSSGCSAYDSGTPVGSVAMSCDASGEVTFRVTNSKSSRYTSRSYFLRCGRPPADNSCPSKTTWVLAPAWSSVVTSGNNLVSRFNVSLGPAAKQQCSCNNVFWGWFETGSYAP